MNPFDDITTESMFDPLRKYVQRGKINRNQEIVRLSRDHEPKEIKRILGIKGSVHIVYRVLAKFHMETFRKKHKFDDVK